MWGTISTKFYTVARIVPIHKKGNKTDFTNYRQTSIVGILAKILEKIIKNRLLEYLERDKIIFTGQYGFRKKLGTEDALIDINNYLLSKRDTKKKILISFLDLEKSFDSISRQLGIIKQVKIVRLWWQCINTFSAS